VGTHCCCEAGEADADREQNGAQTADGGAPPLTLARRCMEMARWMVPGAVLVLLPKCPACLAAYIAIGTGFGISISTATYVRLLLVIVCITSLLLLAARLVPRLFPSVTRPREYIVESE
jgi:hypothetical protein